MNNYKMILLIYPEIKYDERISKFFYPYKYHFGILEYTKIKKNEGCYA